MPLIPLFGILPGWRNGRRRGLKIPWEQSHVGSSPTPGTGCKVLKGRELGGFVLPPLQPRLTMLSPHCAVFVPL